MRAIYRLITTTLGFGMCLAMLTAQARAGCGDMRNWQGPFEFAQPATLPLFTAKAQPSAEAGQRGSSGPSIVGLWKVQFVSQGNANHNPSIPDGAIVDFGYSAWHNDGTEIMNSGGRAPATENFCLGVWGQTGYLTFELNHFALSYDATTGALNGNVNIREQVTLSPSGDMFSGTFTIDVYDPQGNKADHIAGTITGKRLTVDSTLP